MDCNGFPKQIYVADAEEFLETQTMDAQGCGALGYEDLYFGSRLTPWHAQPVTALGAAYRMTPQEWGGTYYLSELHFDYHVVFRRQSHLHRKLTRMPREPVQ